MLSCRGGEQDVHGGLSCPHQPGYQSTIIFLILLILNYRMIICINYKHNLSQIQMISLSLSFVCLDAGLVGKLSSLV